MSFGFLKYLFKPSSRLAHPSLAGTSISMSKNEICPLVPPAEEAADTSEAYFAFG